MGQPGEWGRSRPTAGSDWARPRGRLSLDRRGRALGIGSAPGAGRPRTKARGAGERGKVAEARDAARVERAAAPGDESVVTAGIALEAAVRRLAAGLGGNGRGAQHAPRRGAR